MFDAGPESTDASGEMSSEAQAGIGQLRETLSAVRNLGQLLASRHVGPKTLTGLIPEIRDACGPSIVQAAALVKFADERGRFNGRLSGLEAFATEHIERLHGALGKAAGKMANARARLTLEEEIKLLAPQLTHLVNHLHLVLEAVSKEGLELPLEELLSSRPEHGSSRPFRPTKVYGPVHHVHLRLPARVGVRALALLGEAAGYIQPAFEVQVASGGDVRLDVRDAGEAPFASREPDLVAHIPVMGAIAPSAEVARAVLERYGARFESESRSAFLFPGRVAG